MKIKVLMRNAGKFPSKYVQRSLHRNVLFSTQVDEKYASVGINYLIICCLREYQMCDEKLYVFIYFFNNIILNILEFLCFL